MAFEMFLNIIRYISPTSEQKEGLNINNIFKPLYYILTLFGLFPYSVSYNKSNDRFSIVKNSLFINALCAGFYVVVNSVFSVVHSNYVFSSLGSNSMTDELMTKLNYALEIYAFMVLNVVTYISTLYHKFKFVKILNTACAILTDPRNKSLNGVLGRLRFHVNVVAIGSIIAATILHLTVNFTRDDSFWKKTLVLFSAILPSVIQTTFLALYYIFVMMVVEILDDIKQQLLVITQRRVTIEMLYLDEESRLMKFSLRQLKQTYTKAFEIKRDINEAFQLSLLVSIIQSFHCIVSNAFIIYHGIREGKSTLHNQINCLFWILLQLLKVYSTSYSSSCLKNEVTKIGQALHRIPTENQDLKSYMEIQHFATTMNHHDFVMTVYGYFPLDATLMTAMTANVAMYLIILIQFG